MDPANAKKLGEFAGGDAILTGTVSSLDASIVLTVKAVATASSRLVAAGKISFPKTSEIQQLLNRSVSTGAPGSIAPSVPSGGGNASRYQDATAITAKDVGSLRVVLKSIVPVRSSDGRALRAIRCTYEFINLETQRSLVVAMNAQATSNRMNYAMSEELRSSLTDDRGGLWQLSARNVNGIGVVGAGSFQPSGYAQRQEYSAAQIASLLATKDDMKTDMAPARKPSFDNNLYQFVFGETTLIAPGQSARIVLQFDAVTAPPVGGPPKYIETALEIVTGLVSAGAKTGYSLHTLGFDRVSLPPF